MLLQVARFEFVYQIRNPAFGISFALFFLLTLASVVIDQVQIGGVGNVNVNSPFAIFQTVLVMSIFGLFAVTAFVANAVLRDEETGFAPILRSTRIGKLDFLLGRFCGAIGAALCGAATIPLAVLIGSLAPWLDPETIGPFRADAYLAAYILVAAPLTLTFGAILFALAVLTRSMMGAYLGLIAILAAMAVSGELLNQPELETLAALFDPTGSAAMFRQTEYWTAAERNTLLPSVTGPFIQNRLFWGAVAAGVLALAAILYRLEPPRRRAAPVRSAAARQSAPPAALPLRQQGQPRALAILWARIRFDMGLVFTSPGFAVLLLIGLFNAGGALWYADQQGGALILPTTRLMVQNLEAAFSIIPVIIAAYYAGDLVWKDRERRVHEIIESTPAPDWTFVVPKILAIFAVLAATCLVGALAGALTQAIKGYDRFEPVGYLLWWVVPTLIVSAQLAVLAVFFQAIAPNKYIGWGLIVLFLIASLTLSNLGFQHNLYQFGTTPPAPLSDFSGMAHFWIGRSWFGFYWSAFSLCLVVLAFSVWRRGVGSTLRARIKAAPRRLQGAPGAVLLAGGLAFAASGGWIAWNTLVLNPYESTLDQEKRLADAERALAPFETMAGPRVREVRLDVDIRPADRTALTRGRYMIENPHAVPLGQMLVVWPDKLKVLSFAATGAERTMSWPRFGAEMWTFAEPLAPGERREISFETLYGRPGFANDSGLQRVVSNGTFLDNFDISPMLGVSRNAWLQDRAIRRRNGLDAERRPASLEDPSASRSHYLRPDSDWVEAEITVRTDSDQVAIAPGYLVSETVSEGRSVRTFRTEAPIHHFFSIQSARYAVRTAEAETASGPVRLEIYHHPRHTMNIDRMEKAMRVSLEMFSERFSPFQFRQLRVLEFPGYAAFAQSFANTVPFSEDIGWLQANRRAEDIDLVTFVTAHEIAHQWWAHQVIGADRQGATMLSETFSQYGALLVMEKMFGPQQVRRFVKPELDRYLASRGSEGVEELPLARVENQPYIHYNKGALVMYRLRDEVGEEVVNRALQRLIADFAFRPAPYPATSDFLRYLREEAGPAHSDLIADLFERITLYDLALPEAVARRRPDGGWDVAIAVSARKLHADGQGVETEVAMEEGVEVGLFARRPDEPDLSAGDEVRLERRNLTSGRQQLVISLPPGPAPAFAAIDPYIKRIDRDLAGNIVAVRVETGP
jgi:aminopeptidase N